MQMWQAEAGEAKRKCRYSRRTRAGQGGRCAQRLPTHGWFLFAFRNGSPLVIRCSTVAHKRVISCSSTSFPLVISWSSAAHQLLTSWSSARSQLWTRPQAAPNCPWGAVPERRGSLPERLGKPSRVAAGSLPAALREAFQNAAGSLPEGQNQFPKWAVKCDMRQFPKWSVKCDMGSTPGDRPK